MAEVTSDQWLPPAEDGIVCAYCGDYVPSFRKHFMDRYAPNGAEYGRYSPAYELGHQFAHDHKGMDWTDAERELRDLWKRRGQGEWDDYAEAVRFGWGTGGKT